MRKLISTFLILFVSCAAFTQDYDKTIKGYIVAEFGNSKEVNLSQQDRGVIQQKHMQYIKSLAEDKKLVLAGPYFQGGGLFILNTTDDAAAKDWVENDPTIKSGVNGYTLKKLLTEKGLFTLDNIEKELEIKYGKLNPNAPAETQQYGQLVGHWDVDISSLTKEGAWIDDKASWEFTYILNGYAIQDFWTKPAKPDDENAKDYLGTNIRIFNPESGNWKCTWVQNGNNDLNGVWTSYQNDAGDLILYDDTKNWQITFFNITEDTFDWKWDFKQDDGSMQTRVKIKARRTH